ncbi:hypothetical protein [Lutibacter sp.]|uniref:hypothetical protein n=1 Tax=Lutibacter sp. TaxID=1925666 RepID=UPI0035648774
MKNYKYITLILLVVVFSFSFKINAQQYDENTFLINQYFQASKDASLLKENGLLSNSQIQNSEISLNQVGNKNQIEIKSSGNDAQIVGQTGNNNNYKFINYYNSSPSNFNIIQQGNSNSLQIYGENSIIKNISIIQKTNFDTLIITNH